jgi:two-component system, NtrC family, response regulator HydG
MRTDKKILIIDDEADIRFLLKRALSIHNYEVQEAENLKQGLELFNSMSPDIIILDVNLPDGNGIQFVSKFKRENNKVILISADNDQLVLDFEGLGASGFIKKPFVPQELLEIINNKVIS